MAAIDLSAAAQLAEQAARACLVPPRAPDQSVALLCDMALAEDPELARIGADAIFRHVVEPLADAFDPSLCHVYVRFFAGVIGHARAAAPWLDRRLRRFGLASDHDLVERAERLRDAGPVRPDRLRKILVLSRVTLGADVAVTSVILGKLLARFPSAEIVLLGGAKAAELFAGERRLQSRLVEYPRNACLLDRLAAWDHLARIAEEETRGLGPDQYLAVDPDSRLTQLGMLPVVANFQAHRFWESRSYARPGRAALAELAAAWADEVFGGEAPAPLPWVRLPEQPSGPAPNEPGARRWAAVNLGVGDNPRKRIPGDFEERLLRALLDSGWAIFLDTGGGGEETERVERLLHRLGRPQDLVPWRGTLAGFGALIAQSRLFVGYDSAAAHLAAALGTPVVDIFAGYSSPRMRERWRPTGPAPVTLIDAEGAEPDHILRRVLEAAR